VALIASVCAAGAVAIVALAGCGSSHSQATVQVGGVAIAQSQIQHWASVITRGGFVPTLREGAQLTPREHALEFLIVSHWLTGEAAALGVRITGQQIAGSVGEQERSLPGGAKEFRENLQITGEADADVRLRAASRLAAIALRKELVSHPRPVSSSEAERYFDSHRLRFAIPERRTVDIAEKIPSRAAAVRLERSMERTGDRTQLTYHELLTEQGTATESAPVARAIFTAPEGVLMGPVLHPSGYILFEVKRILPKELRRFPGFRKAIIARLERQRAQVARSHLDHRLEESWRSKTSCQRGYVVPQCKEYAGARSQLADPFAAGGSFAKPNGY
jgi:PPIC-type PPIASE domain